MSDRARIAARLQALWEIRRGPGGGADRPAYSGSEAEAMRLVAGWAAQAGLEPGVDPHGNLWALPPGWSGGLITAGSHVDTVPDGGRFDGALGTVLGIELVDELAAGAEARGGPRPALLVCAAEEAPRFGAGTIGSRLLVGSLAPDELAELRDADGGSAADALAEFLAAVSAFPIIDPPLDRLRAHAEIHVAQRSSLRELGVVERVAALRRLEIRLVGAAGHAGEVPMETRRDALAAAAEVILAIELAARAEPAETVATVGTLSVDPGAISVIPAMVRLGVDLRGISADSLQRLEAAIRGAVADVAGRRGIEASVRLLRGGEPVQLDAGLAGAALGAAERLQIPAGRTWSGAGHDAQHLGGRTPTLLLFVPLRGGESHTPAEGADPGDIDAATRVVAAVLSTVS